MTQGLQIGTSGSGNQVVRNLHIGTAASGNQDVIRAYVGTPGGNEICHLHLPGQPASFSATVNAASPASAIDLSWAHHATYDTADSWVIERAPDSAGSPGTWSTIESNWTGGTSYTDTGLDADTTYWYRVSGKNYQGTGTASAQDAATTQDVAPAAPTGLSATQNAFYPYSRISLSWTDNSDNETGFKIERSPNGSTSWSQIDTVGANVHSYTDTGIPEGTLYYYRVRAYNAYGDSAYSNVDSAYTAVQAPTGLTATKDGTDPYGQINLSWTDNSSGETAFYIERSSTGSSSGFSAIDNVAGNVTNYEDGTVDEGTQYWYRVRAYKNGIYSDYSNVDDATTDVEAPAAPSGLTATKDATYPTSRIDLSWTDNSTDEDGFSIERSDDGSSYSEIDTVGAGVTAYEDTGLLDNQQYWYRVRAYKGTTYSDYSLPATETTDQEAPSSAPTGLSATPDSTSGETELDVSWGTVADATGYKLYRGTSSSFTPDDATNKIYDGASTSYDDSGRSQNTTYWYKVLAYNGGGDGPVSSAASGTTWPTVPQSFTGTHDGTYIDLSWDNGTRSEAKTLQVYNHTTSSWDTISSTIGTSVEEYLNHAYTSDHESGGQVTYRIRFNSEATYATEYVIIPI